MERSWKLSDNPISDVAEKKAFVNTWQFQKNFDSKANFSFCEVRFLRDGYIFLTKKSGFWRKMNALTSLTFNSMKDPFKELIDSVN